MVYKSLCLNVQNLVSLGPDGYVLQAWDPEGRQVAIHINGQRMEELDGVRSTYLGQFVSMSGPKSQLRIEYEM